MNDSIVQIGLYVSYGLIALAAVAAIILPLINSLSQPKNLLKSGAGLTILVAVFGLAYSLSSNEVSAKYTEAGVTAGSSQVVGGMLTMVYLLVGFALVGIVVTEIAKLFK